MGSKFACAPPPSEPVLLAVGETTNPKEASYILP